MLTASRNCLFYLLRPLHIDIQKQIVSARLSLAQKASCRSVVVTEDFRMLQKLTRRDHGFKFFPRDEDIFLAILLASAWRPR